MAQKDYYSILGVDKNASTDDIKKAYKKLCIKYHPDKSMNASEKERKDAEEKFKEINEANSVLSDEEKRKNYDMFGTADSMGGSNDGWDPFGQDFNPFSRFHHQSVVKGEDREATVTISFEEAYKGTTAKVKIKVEKECSHCHGTGSADGKQHKCTYCNGAGTIRQTRRNGNTLFSSEYQCPYCHGTGNLITEPCPYCNGSGYEYDIEEMTANIPAGVTDGSVFKIRGAGAPPKGGNGINGDAFVKITVTPSDDFEREEDDLVYHLKLDLMEAWVGTKKTVKNLDGTTVKVVIPPLTKPGKNFIVNGGGYTVQSPFGIHKGDFIVRVDYKIPEKPLSSEQISLLKQFYNSEK